MSDRLRIPVEDEHVGADDLIGLCWVTVGMDRDGGTPEVPETCPKCGGILDERDQQRLVNRALDALFERSRR